ncbi:DUF11 domain-containing protein, partial [candidate division KSB1 bacterium]|nr:DUF11 domain-containing protein [candidate division KSB1 bacterium]
MTQAYGSLVRKALTYCLRILWVAGLIGSSSDAAISFSRPASSRWLGVASVLETPEFAPASKPDDPPAVTAAIAYTFSVDKSRPEISDSLIYRIVIWNDPLLSDTLRSVEAEFSLPRLQNGNFALQLATFRYTGPYPFVTDTAQGKITWQLGDIIRHTPRLPSDTVGVAFSFHLADVSEFALECGENPLTAFARVSFLDGRGQRIYPGTQRAAESTLALTPDFVAIGVTSAPQRLQRGDTLAVTYSYRNAGNVGRALMLCLRIPNGFSRNGILVVPDSLRLRLLPPDSLCVDLGFVAAGNLGAVTLRFPIEQNLSAQADSLCLRGALVTDCDREPANNFYSQVCSQIEPLDLLAVTKTAARNRVEVGDTLVYTIRFENRDALVTAWNVVITDMLPFGVDLLTADSVFTFANGVLIWQRAQLPPQGSGTLRFSVRIRPDFYATQGRGLACLGAQITNVVNITSTAPDGSPSPESSTRMANNSSAVAVHIAPLGDVLEITQTLTALPPANLASLLPGDTLQYALFYGNRNTRLLASNVTVIDSLPDARFVQLVLDLLAPTVAPEFDKKTPSGLADQALNAPVSIVKKPQEKTVPLPDMLVPARFRHPQANREVLLGDAVVAYALQRARRRSIGFTVGADGLSVRAPTWVTVAAVDAALREKSGWILRKLGEAQERQQRLEHARIDWRDGTVLPYLGAPLRVVLDPAQ